MAEEMGDLVEKFTARALAAADGILAQGFPDEGEPPEVVPLDAVRNLIAVGFGTGKQEGLAEGRVHIEEMQAHLAKLLKLIEE